MMGGEVGAPVFLSWVSAAIFVFGILSASGSAVVVVVVLELVFL